MDGVVTEAKSFERCEFIRGCPVSADEIRLFAFSKVTFTGQWSVAVVFLKHLNRNVN